MTPEAFLVYKKVLASLYTLSSLSYRKKMMAKLAFILCGSLQLAFLCSAVPLERRTMQTPMQLPAQFDAGPVNSCEIPATNFCSVGYSVPTSVASLTLVIEEEIRKQYERDKANGLECAQGLRTIRCAQRFPRCSADSSQVTLSSLNCTERVSLCPENIRTMLQAEGFCTLGSTSLMGNCKPVTEYGYQFRHCPMGSSDNWYVTRWMHDVMVHADVQLVARFNGTALSSISTECKRKYATYFCQFMGRCTSHVEPRVEVVNTYEQCEDMINCFPDWLASTLRKILACSLWPSQLGSSLPVSTLPPVATNLTTEQPSGSSNDSTLKTTATTVRPTLPNTNPDDLFPNSSSPVATEPSESSNSTDDSTQGTMAKPTTNTYTDPEDSSIGSGNSGSGDDSMLGTATRPTGPVSTTVDPTDMLPTGIASLHSVCVWTLLFLTIFATLDSL